jgi:glucosamine kinase
MSKAENQPLFLGIDGGGSKCRSIVVNQRNEILGTGVSGPANPMNSFETTIHSIVESAELALLDAGMEKSSISQLNAGAGLAGVNFKEGYDKIMAWDNPFAKFCLTTDLHTACIGAHDGQDGAVMIVGTGSIGIDVRGDDHFILGGHGFLQGDMGSGAWFGLQAVRRALTSADLLSEPTIMLDLLLKHFDSTTHLDIMEAMANKPAKNFAQLARIVFEAEKLGDAVAREVVEQGADYLSRLALRLFERNPRRFSMVGGLSPIVLPFMAKEVQERVEPTLQEPEMGAVYYARTVLELS